MTAKEALRDLIDDLTEDEARSLVVQGEFAVAQRRKREAPHGTLNDLHARIRAISARIPVEEWAKVPPAKDMDKYLYQDLETWFAQRRKAD
ncbi:MAG: hypothetical protein WD557_14610 [Dehalococcoidia bacterium]